MILKILGYATALSLIFCIYFIIKRHSTLKQSDQFEGSVIGYESREGRKSATYALKIEYKDQNSISHTFVASGSSCPPAREIGAKVLVFQHPDGTKPDILVFESVYLGLWIWFCLGILATGCLLAPYILTVLYKK